MFTGLVEGTGVIRRLAPQGPDLVMTIRPPWDLAQVVLGESVAVSGACLTATGQNGEGFTVDVSAESLRVTRLGRLAAGDLVNLERPLRLGGRLDGHLVTGHVDCLGRVARITRVGGSLRLALAIPPEHLALVVPKGSLAVDGISLTVNRVTPTGCELNIIPHTWEGTTLRLAKEGDSVNIETDLIGKYVARLLNREPGSAGEAAGGVADQGASGGLDQAALRRMGF
ncbi:MAG: riboflavin synthase [Deltaproteobacteria bacterium]|nr:riboflavin synthase [Deltaproteobacteria bacterium]